MAAKYACTAITFLLATAIVGGCTPSPTPPAEKAVSSVAVLNQTNGPVNRDATVVFGVQFDVPVSGFDDAAADVMLMHDGTGGGQMAIFPISDQSYVVVVNGVTGDGSYQLLVLGSAAQDAMGNLNPPGLSSPVPVDNTPPQLTVIGTQVQDGRYGAGTAVDLLVDFSEPVTMEGSFQISLNTGQPVEFQGFTSLLRTSAIFMAQAGDNANPLDSVTVTGASGTRMFDAAGNVGQITIPALSLASVHNIIIDTAAPVASMKKTSTNSLAKLAGTVNDPTATVVVSIIGASYLATNNGDGTWSLSEAAITVPLPDGTYDVTITASDTVGNVSADTVTGAVTLDGTPPQVIVTSMTTYDATPTIEGSVNDKAATIKVTIAGNTYQAKNNGDYTWTVANGMISPPLEKGTYDVAVEATDPAGNVGRDTTTNELTIDW